MTSYIAKVSEVKISEIFFLPIDSKWSETRKKHEIGDAEFLPVAGAGSRRSTDFTSREC